jgi:SPP1 gp7 family putative phage head morphogenesis protein
MPRLLTDPIPHTEGVALIADKPAVTRAVFDRLAPELQARAFLITGVEALDAVARVRELVAKLPAGGDFRDLKEEIRQNISPFLVTSTDPEERAKQEGAATRRAELLLRLHGWQAYAQTQHDLMEAHKDAFPYRQYLSSEDDRVRETHAALNRKILPANHSFWQTHTPPWEFNCRCDCVPLTEEEVNHTRAGEAHKAPENQDVLPAAQLDEIERNGRMVKANGQGFYDVRTPRQKTGEGYEWRPGDRGLDLDQILARFTPQERSLFEQWARATKADDGRDLMSWFEKGAQPGAAPPPPQAPAPVPAPASPPPAPRKRPAGPLPADPVDRERARIARANYKNEYPIGGRGNVNTTIRLKNGQQVVFKPAAGEYQGILRLGISPGTQFKREKAASIVDQYLGTHLVPPTEIIDWQGKTGSAQKFMTGYVTAADYVGRHGSRPPLNQETKRRISLLDEVTGNLDRHMGNWMVKDKQGIMQLAAIDNGLSFSTHPESSGTRVPVPLSGKPLDQASIDQLDSFMARRAEWEPKVEPLVGRDAVRLMVQRISKLRTNGFGNVAQRIT